jgi:hypothetical protein
MSKPRIEMPFVRVKWRLSAMQMDTLFVSKTVRRTICYQNNNRK